MPGIAALAGLILIAIWVYISGRKGGERSRPTLYWVKELTAIAIICASAGLSITLFWVAGEYVTKLLLDLILSLKGEI